MGSHGPGRDPGPRGPADVSSLTSGHVLERLRRLARDELEMKPDELEILGPATALVEGLRLDSLKQVVLVTAVEEEFGFELGYEDGERLRSLRTVGDLVQLIRERAAGGGPWT